MKSYFDVTAARWGKRTTDILPKHDIFFGSPINDPRAGIPLGDGDTGSLLWFEKDGLHIHINKCDLWHDSTWDDGIYCSGKEEDLSCLKHGGELTLKLSSPVFDYYYQSKFQTRLSFADACAYMENETPFGGIKGRMFASAEYGVTALELDIGLGEGDSPELTLMRWGSRTFWRWYDRQLFSPETGLDGTEAYAEGNRLYVTQDIGSTKFCLGLAVVGDACIESAKRKNCHEASIRLTEGTKHTFTLYYTVKLGEDLSAAKRNCAEALDKAVSADIGSIYEAHRAAWSDFWNKSFVSLTDDYVENMYYHYLYVMNSGSRGKYPPHFTSGLWGFNRDYLPWVYYFHYNIQHMYAPLDVCGHGELAQNYFDLRKNGLSSAYRYAEAVKGKKGAFVHDVTDRFGRGADYDSHNLTPGAQIAMRLWEHWQHTGDEAFLRDYVLPQMKGVAEFYLDNFEKGEDGKYHIRNTTMYEGHIPTDDTLTDIVMVKALFTAYLPYAEETMKGEMETLLANLPELPVEPLSEFDWDGEVFTYGIGKGKRPLGDKTVFVGGMRDGKPVRVMYGNPDKDVYGFPDIELSPIYPAGIFGLKDKGTADFDRMMNQIYIHRGSGNMHWNMIPVYLARMGLGEELKECLRERIHHYQSFCNGFGAEQGMDGCKPPYAVGEWYNVRNTETNLRTKVKTDLYTHFDFEMGPILAQGVNESLLQSHEGFIRLCPAVCKEDEVSFSLYARGGFKVTAQVSAEALLLTAESLRGEELLIKPPEAFEDREIFAYVKALGSSEFSPAEKISVIKGSEAVWAFNLNKGDILLLASEDISALEYEPYGGEAPNCDMKECGQATLGSPTLLK